MEPGKVINYTQTRQKNIEVEWEQTNKQKINK